MRFLILLLFLLCSSIPYSLTARSQPKADSLWSVWNSKSMPDSARMRALGLLVNYHYLNTNPDSAILLCNWGLALAERTKSEKTYAEILRTRSKCKFKLGKLDSALADGLKSSAIKHRLGDKRGEAEALMGVGHIYLEQAKPDIAIRVLFDALRIIEAIHENDGAASLYMAIGNVYHRQKDYNKAILLYHRGYTFSQLNKNILNMGTNCGSVGLGYLALDKFEIAALYFRKAEKYMLLAGRKEPVTMLPKIYYNLGIAFIGMNQLDSATACFEKTMAIYEVRKDTTGMALCFKAMGETALKKGDARSAITLCEKGLALLRNSQVIKERERLTAVLYEAYRANKNFEKAFEIYQLHIQLRDSISSNEKKQVLFQEETKYNYEKQMLAEQAAHERALARLNLIRAEETAQKNTWMLLLAALCALFVIVGYFMYGRFRQRKIIADQKANLLKQQLLVSQLNPHFIFNSLNAVQQYIFSQNSHEAGIYLGRFSELMRMILDFSREDFIPVESELHFIKEYLELQQLRFPQRFRYEIITDPAIDQTALQLPPMIAQPFIENAVEHGISRDAANGLITVRLFIENNLLHYEIEDNGIGLEAASQQERKSKHRSLATVIVRERLDALQQGRQQYTVMVTDKATAGGKGVLVRITVPFIR